jgi:hypothetical protein
MFVPVFLLRQAVGGQKKTGPSWKRFCLIPLKVDGF